MSLNIRSLYAVVSDRKAYQLLHCSVTYCSICICRQTFIIPVIRHLYTADDTYSLARYINIINRSIASKFLLFINCFSLQRKKKNIFSTSLRGGSGFENYNMCCNLDNQFSPSNLIPPWLFFQVNKSQSFSFRTLTKLRIPYYSFALFAVTQSHSFHLQISIKLPLIKTENLP